ncbi:alcohol dehydrogenase catalytic domain-containing protein [Albidovulum aquaemixtae]|uniref:alcohol dehydrogenase catalytic domain-containing protein n=1 Tax=Albidovulum aquaemixtae TaxID=1542388 RepID=UPI000D54EA70
MRQGCPPEGHAPAVFGCDAVGEVVETGDEAAAFRPGDEVWYAGAILDEVSALLDAGKIKSTATETLGAVTANNLKRAHAILESGKARGKLVREGF